MRSVGVALEIFFLQKTYTMLELLNDLELDQLMGGAHVTTRIEYCNTLHMLIDNNWDSWSSGEKESAAAAYFEHCN